MHNDDWHKPTRSQMRHDYAHCAFKYPAPAGKKILYAICDYGGIVLIVGVLAAVGMGWL